MALKSRVSSVVSSLRENGPHPVPPALITRTRLRGATRLHLGSGLHLLPGWANLDFVLARGVVTHDLTRPLPIDAGSIDFIFTEHFVEHITRQQAVALMQDCHRALRDGGVIRISTPDLASLAREYTEGRTGQWEDVGWTPATPCQMLNEGMHLWGHKFVYDHEELTALLREVGFVKVERVDWRQSAHPELSNLECRPFHHEVIVEATK